ncbi:disease resistance protein RGA2 [Citrus clementina]|uniref:disease resistance protein RGA2 n=1 Tax=Citrus clementina TaxID=85681 RepID=UPI000CED46D4|nr:disease resistance protein RGA2 [Citrus x clementina]
MVESYFPIEKLLEKLGSFAYEELLLFCGVKNDLQKLKETLTTVKSVVLDAEEKQIHNHRLSDWLGKLKDACYDAEDVLDEFEVEDLRRQVMKQRSIGRKFRNFFGCSNPIAFRFRMGHQIKKIRERFDEIAKLRGEFNLIERLDDHRRVVHKERESTHSFVLSSDIIGRDKDREKIIELLMQASSGESETLSVIPIVGIGGLGKTALAQLVFNDQRVEEHFELKIWMRVFEDFGGRQIMREIMESIIVQIMRKCVFLVGTRGGTIGYNLQGLPFEDCLSLFMKCAFKEERDKHPNLIKIGEEIVKKCGGIPLAVRALGSLLCGKTDKRNWEYVRDIEIWQLEQMDTGILRALRLSYDQLPPHLKQCVAYCSIFPKGYQFYGDSLVQFWMAHGLLQSHNKKEELDDIGMRYLKELLSRFFFQDLSFGMLGMETFSFKMHDLMHDLSLLVAKDEFLVVNSDCQFIPKKVRHLSFVAANASRNDFSSLLSDLGRVRTIFFSTDDDEKTSQSFIESCISKSQFLRVLDLSGSAIEVCPREMGNLKHTRYLDLSKNYKIKKLPKSICELQSLQTLNLAGCLELEELPKDIRYLVNLRLLALTTKQKSLQESGIRSLGSLRCLSISSCWNLEHLFEEIDQLSVLRTLSIESCPRLISLPPAIKYLSSLENLYLVKEVIMIAKTQGLTFGGFSSRK